jgi:hypothetical protein
MQILGQYLTIQTLPTNESSTEILTPAPAISNVCTRVALIEVNEILPPKYYILVEKETHEIKVN